MQSTPRIYGHIIHGRDNGVMRRCFPSQGVSRSGSRFALCLCAALPEFRTQIRNSPLRLTLGETGPAQILHSHVRIGVALGEPIVSMTSALSSPRFAPCVTRL